MNRFLLSLVALCLLLIAPAFSEPIHKPNSTVVASSGFGVGNNLMGFWQKKTEAGGAPVVALTRGTCVNSTTNTNSYTFNTTGTGALDASSVLVVAGVVGRDALSNFGISSMTFDGVGGTELADQGGTEIVSAGIYRASAASINNATVNVVVTFTEAIESATVCLWALENLNSTTPTGTGTDSDSASNAVGNTITSQAGGFAIGIGISTSAGDFVWSNVTERQDVSAAEMDYSNADGPTTTTTQNVQYNPGGGLFPHAIADAAFR